MLCVTCAHRFDSYRCDRSDFGEVIDCSGYIPKTNKNPLHNKGYVIPYNFPLNTRKGFNAIYYLMRLIKCDMTSAIIIIIKARHKSINVILDACNKIEKENNDIIQLLYN